MSSKEYKEIWVRELKENPHLFKTKIISKHNIRKEAIEKEFILQKALNVVKSSLYINKSFAMKNGFFGMEVPKESHHSYGGLEWDTERRINHGKKKSEYFIENEVMWINKNGKTKHIPKKSFCII